MINIYHPKIWIGVTNLTMPGNKSTFPGEFQSQSRLHYYSTLFRTTELNSTFYKLPLATTYNKWQLDVTNNFLFTIKLSKTITHVKELLFNKDDIELFINRASSLGTKKGCILIQFPGKITLDNFNKVEELLEILIQSNGIEGWRLAVEFRHASWYVGEGFELLDEFNASMVLHDFRKVNNERLNSKASFVYRRYHGPDGNYKGTYKNEFLLDQAGLIKNWAREGKEVFVYFNNTVGDAFNNARILQMMMDQ